MDATPQSHDAQTTLAPFVIGPPVRPLAQARARRLSPDYWSAGYLAPEDISAAAEMGFAALVNLLPVDDADQKIPHPEAKRLAETQGLVYRHMPLYGHQVNNEYIARAYGAMIAELPQPVLAYCRSGLRVALLWGMIRAADLGVSVVLDQALMAGYDISVITDELKDMAKKPSPLKPLRSAA